MKSKVLGILVSALLALPTAANALVVGDKDWRQLTETTGYTWNAVAALCPVATGVCTGALSGWNWATNTDIRGLFNQLLSPHQILSATGDFYEANSSEIAAAIGVGALAATQVIPGGSDLVAGWSRSPRPSAPFDATYAYTPRLYDAVDPLTRDYATLNTYTLITRGENWLGVWLYRSAVPEPGTLALMGLGLAGLAGLRRRRTH